MSNQHSVRTNNKRSCRTLPLFFVCMKSDMCMENNVRQNSCEHGAKSARHDSLTLQHTLQRTLQQILQHTLQRTLQHTRRQECATWRPNNRHELYISGLFFCWFCDVDSVIQRTRRQDWTTWRPNTAAHTATHTAIHTAPRLCDMTAWHCNTRCNTHCNTHWNTHC